MKKKATLLIAVMMGIIAMFGAGTTKAEATTVTISGPHVQMKTVSKQTTCTLKGEVKVSTTSATTPKYAKITVDYQGKRYRDCCAKFLRTERILDEKGNPTGEYNHIYKFCGCKIK